MWKRIIHFVQYHNFFTIAVLALFMGASASFAASPELQKSVINKTDVVRSVDNTFVVNTDFDTYDLGLKILSVKEDADMYYVDYSYNTIMQQDFVWQPVPTNNSMKVSKKELARRDLGLYVAGQLGQVLEQQISYLKEVQKNEKEKGLTQKVVATEYSGLVGQLLGTEEKAFEGYTPVKPPPTPAPVATVPDTSGAAAVAAANPNTGVSTVSYGAPPEGSLTREQVQALIQDTVKQLLAQGNTPPADTGTPPSPPPSTTPSSPPADTTTPPPPPADTTTPPPPA
ncbi:MAG: hypothetical protein WA058_01850, partial [Minisyncoccia bacterium]